MTEPAGVPALAAPPPAADRALRILAVVVGTAAAVLVALAGGFLVPLRIGSTAAPICLLVAVLGNVAALRYTYRVSGWKAAMTAPALAWLITTMPLTIRRDEGDLIITGTATGFALLVLGSLALAGTAYVGIISGPLPNEVLRNGPEPVTGASPRGTM